MKRAKTDSSSSNRQHAHMLGVGLDNTDGDNRLTRGKNFTLVGGSEETHAVMQETAIKVNEKPLDAIKRVLDISGDEKASIAGVTFSVKTIAIIVGSALGGTALIIAVLLIIRKKRHR